MEGSTIKAHVQNQEPSDAESRTGKGANHTEGQKVVKKQVKAVVGDLENVLGELKTVVGDLRVLVNQIDVVTNKIDEEYGTEVRSFDKRRRSTSLLETGTPKKDKGTCVRHSVSQPFDVLRQNERCDSDPPSDQTIVTKLSEPPSHSNSNSTVIHKKVDTIICHEHTMASDKKDDCTVFRASRKDDIIICTPGSTCHKKGTRTSLPSNASSRRNNDVVLYENVPIASSRTPSKSGSHIFRSPRTSSCSKSQSQRTSNSSGIGNINCNGNGNAPRDKHKHSYSKSIRTKRNSLREDDRNLFADDSNKDINFGKTEPTTHYSKGAQVDRANVLNVHHTHCSPCSPSPDSDYCGVYERELDLKLELVFDDGFDNAYDDRRTLDLEPYPGYGASFVRERVSRWAAYTVVNIDRLPTSDDQLTETPSETSSDILNDNVLRSSTSYDYSAPWDSLFDRNFARRFDSTDIG